jgi:hypothetical protein
MKWTYIGREEATTGTTTWGPTPRDWRPGQESEKVGLCGKGFTHLGRAGKKHWQASSGQGFFSSSACPGHAFLQYPQEPASEASRRVACLRVFEPFLRYLARQEGPKAQIVEAQMPWRAPCSCSASATF